MAESVAARATASTTALAKLHSCASNVTAANEERCARTIATSLAPRAYRRTVATTEIDELVALYTSVRALSTTVTFASGVAAMIEAMLQSPEFLYRVELGTAVAGNTAVKRVAGREMATRLSYLFWQTMPDAALFQAADAGMLDTKEGVQQQAQKMLDDPRSHPMVAFFFDNLLPIPGPVRPHPRRRRCSRPGRPASAPRCGRRCSAFSSTRSTRTRRRSAPPYAPGSWPAILTAPYTFVNQALFNYYGASTFAPGTSASTGTALTKVDLNTTQRLGLLTLGGMMAGSTTSDLTNPVLRGSFIINKLMCRNIELPTGFNADGRPIRTAARRRASAVLEALGQRPSAPAATRCIDPARACRSRTTTPSGSIARASGGPTRRR